VLGFAVPFYQPAVSQIIFITLFSRSLSLSQQETVLGFAVPFYQPAVSQIIFITLFSLSLSLSQETVLGFAVPFFHQLQLWQKNYAKMLGQNHFVDPTKPTL
jgi:hypothetical protein